MDITTPSNPISDILSRLMFEKRIRTAELARQIRLPQPTVHRIVTGTSPKPHSSSLTPLANFFGISLEQLKGLKPIPWLNPQESKTASGFRQLPVLKWDEILTWEQNPHFIPTEVLFCDVNVSPRSFIVRMTDASMSPQFPIGTLLTIDPEKAIKDRSFVMAHLKNSTTALFRQLLIDGPNYHIKPISPDFDHFKMTMLTEEDKI